MSDREHGKTDLLVLLCSAKEQFLCFENSFLALDLIFLDSSLILFLKRTVGFAIIVLPTCVM